ncbi:hypothetical protein Chor_000619 [Crotalus horridus]
MKWALPDYALYIPQALPSYFTSFSCFNFVRCKELDKFKMTVLSLSPSPPQSELLTLNEGAILSICLCSFWSGGTKACMFLERRF